MGVCNCTQQKSDLALLEDVLQKYQSVSGSLITILQKAQDIYGYLPIDVIYHVAERTGNTPAKVMGVATFYAQFRLKPIGKYLIMLCKGTACHVNGGGEVASAVQEALGVTDGATTPDGLFSWESVACLGCCSLSPAMMINGRAYGSLTREKTLKIIADIRAQEGRA